MNFTKKELERLRANRDIEGEFEKDGERWIDLRKTAEAIARQGLSARTADLNVADPLFVRLPPENISPDTEGDV